MPCDNTVGSTDLSKPLRISVVREVSDTTAAEGARSPRSVDSMEDAHSSATNSPRSPRSPSALQLVPPATGPTGSQRQRVVPLGIIGKLRLYNIKCLSNAGYRRSLALMLISNVGDGIMLGASGRIFGLLRLAPIARGVWTAFVLGNGEKLVGQAAELANANRRDNARAAGRNLGNNTAAQHLCNFRNSQVNLMRQCTWVDVACCAAWVGIAVGTLAVGSTVWPVTLAVAAVALVVAWSRSGRSVAWDNLRFNMDTRARDTPERALGSTIGCLERILSLIATGLGAAIALGVEAAFAPVYAPVGVAIVVGTLVVGCLIGAAAKFAHARQMSRLPVARGRDLGQSAASALGSDVQGDATAPVGEGVLAAAA